MIHQVTPIPQDCTPIKKARLKLKGTGTNATKPDSGMLWSPITAGPYLVPIIRWID